MSMENARKAVRKGAAVLDKYADIEGGFFPGWRGRIDLENLDMSNTGKCVLGQLFGEYTDGTEVLGLRWDQARKLAFDSNAGNYEGNFTYHEAADAWREYLADRVPAGGQDSIWEQKNNPDRHLKIVGGMVYVGDVDYWPVAHGYMREGEFQVSGDPSLIRSASLYENYRTYQPKPKFPVGSFLTDRETSSVILFVASDDLVYRMETNAGSVSYNSGAGALDWYVEQYGELVPLLHPLTRAKLVIEVKESE